jgi:hypothetical protein
VLVAASSDDVISGSHFSQEYKIPVVWVLALNHDGEKFLKQRFY